MKDSSPWNVVNLCSHINTLVAYQSYRHCHEMGSLVRVTVLVLFYISDTSMYANLFDGIPQSTYHVTAL